MARACQAPQVGSVGAQRRELGAQAAQRGRFVARLDCLQVLVLQNQEACLPHAPPYPLNHRLLPSFVSGKSY